MALKLIQITDLHLSDRTDTPAADALRWAIGESNRLAPDLVAFTGDMTTYGSAAAAQQVLDAATQLDAPWVFTPGNADLRSDQALSVLQSKHKSLLVNGITFLLPDTSTGRLSESERAWLSAQTAAGPLAMLTHYSLDTLDADSRIWIETWIAAHGVELYLAGHRHFTRTRRVAGCLEVITRGLDPDKAFGGPPGISLLQRTTDGDWTEQAIPWPHGRDLLPAETEHSPVGWSIRGNPVETVRETYDFGLNVLELRPREADYDLATTVAELKKLRGDRPVYLSWHLPNLAWDVSSSTVSGQDLVAQQVDHAQACGADAFTVHVPQIGAHLMDQGNDEWQAFLRAFEALFKQAIDDGVRLSIENVHNDPGTALAREGRKFATHIDEYETWIRSVISALGTDSSRIGAHFDIGHARNNGELGNLQPIGDWYACIGRYITGYHIHQVRPHEETHKLVNHRDIKSTYDRTISYAGFLHAWSNRLINRAPLFVEVRKAEERRRTTRLLLDIIAGEAE